MRCANSGNCEKTFQLLCLVRTRSSGDATVRGGGGQSPSFPGVSGRTVVERGLKTYACSCSADGRPVVLNGCLTWSSPANAKMRIKASVLAKSAIDAGAKNFLLDTD